MTTQDFLGSNELERCQPPGESILLTARLVVGDDVTEIAVDAFTVRNAVDRTPTSSPATTAPDCPWSQPRMTGGRTMIDLTPAAKRMAMLVEGVRDAQLESPTPCAGYSLGDLLDHVDGLSWAFGAAATKSSDERLAAPPGPPDASRLGGEWRSRIPDELATLADAWKDPRAWTGMTRAGGIEMPGEVCGLVALNEVVLHGWDVARASGQPYESDAPSVEACLGFVAQFSGPEAESLREGMFGPIVEVPEDAPPLDRLLGLSGRDPAWTPETGGG
jgi:uncharacterized protein (TIGR03086 family)